MSDREKLARKSWGALPDWVSALITACDAPGTSQRKVADKLGVSPAVVSQIISNKYAADLSNMEDRIRSVFLSGDVECPALGTISSKTCLRWRDKAADLRSSSPIAVQMFKSCNACPRFNAEIEDAGTKNV